MSKRPYIQFYLGDYIKDTRILPLNVKGGWIDLILAMWENDPQGELTGCITDFARIMNCDIHEANLVIQTLKQKKIFNHYMISDDVFKIESRKQKKMLNLSKTRKETGGKGGNPALLNQKDNQPVNQKDKLNAEYEYDNEYRLSREGVQGENEKWNFKPGEKEMDIPLPDIKAGAATELYYHINKKMLSPPEIEALWGIFKKQNFTGNKPYHTIQETYSHFINWIKTQKTNGTDKQHTSNGKHTSALNLLTSIQNDLAVKSRGSENH